MIIVKLNQPGFEYDIHSLVKSFYPAEDVYVSVQECQYATDEIRLSVWKEKEKREDKPLNEQIVPVAEADRKEVKNRLKRVLYTMLSEHTGITLPWGTLSGIRPVKIPMQLLEEGKSRDEIASYMKDTYYCSDGKIKLSLDIAKRELALLQKLDYEHGYSIYIGIPFCPSTCLYCSFTSYPLSAWRDRVDAYLYRRRNADDFKRGAARPPDPQDQVQL